MNLPKLFTDQELEFLYNLLDVPMIDFDCGPLCASDNNGVPFCCDSQKTVPLLFKDELYMHQKKSAFWRVINETDPAYNDFKAYIDEDGYEVLSICPGCSKCERDLRALVCRTYPFEPFLDEEGALVALTYNMDEKGICPLIDKNDVSYNPKYIQNSLIYWDFIFQKLPEQFDIYMDNSDELRERVAQGEKIRIFTPASTTGEEL